MVAPRAGRNGRIYIDASTSGTLAATPVSLLNTWSLDQPTDKIEVTSFGDTTKTYVVGLPDAQGSFGGFWDGDATTLYNIVGSSVARKIYIYPDTSNDVATYWYGTAYFDVSTSGDVGDAVKIDVSWAAASSFIYVP